MAEAPNPATASLPDGTPAPNGAERRRRRRVWLASLSVMTLLTVGGGIAYEVFVGGNTVSTDDAYVGADVAQITPLVSGIVATATVQDAQFVHAGDVLVTLDPADFRYAVEQDEAQYIHAVRAVEQTRTTNATLAAQIAQREADVAKAHDELNRRAILAKQGWVSGETLHDYRSAADAADAALVAAQAQLAANEKVSGTEPLLQHPDVAVIAATLKQARLNLERTVIRAPIDGIVARRNVQVGEHVEAGSALMSVVPVAQVYVDANFKESQLGRVKVGETVSLTSDFYGPDIVFKGHVAGIGGGTGAAFALIPAQNATGNWIKVVQRVPVRITLDPAELASHPLRVGLSMTATIRLDEKLGA